MNNQKESQLLTTRIAKASNISRMLPVIQTTPQLLRYELSLRPRRRPLHLLRRHFSLQYLTSSQFLAQLLRQTIGRPQHKQILLGRPLDLRNFAGCSGLSAFFAKCRDCLNKPRLRKP